MRVSLFWRTFGLVATLIVFSLAITLQLVRVFDRAPPEQQLAWEIASVVNLTRSALVSSLGDRRSALLDELARDEGVRIAVLEPGDRAEPLGGARANAAAVLERRLKTHLGPGTRLAGRVNGEPALWVSFEIEGDGYWLAMSLDRWTRQAPAPWWLIASIAIALSLAGALAISRLVNRPLAALAGAIERVSGGDASARLAETGPSEIANVNRSFNRMAAEIDALDADRALAMAGISHDIRTPLTRLRIELEMAPLDDDTRASAEADIEHIDAVVGKFVEYARIGATVAAADGHTQVDVAALIGTLAESFRASARTRVASVDLRIPAGTVWRGDATDLARVVSNLLENAARYGAAPGASSQITVSARADDLGLTVSVCDRGPGVPTLELERLTRPFARLDASRGASSHDTSSHDTSSHDTPSHGASGLGLAIVTRIARRYAGSCVLSNREGGGLAARVELRHAA